MAAESSGQSLQQLLNRALKAAGAGSGADMPTWMPEAEVTDWLTDVKTEGGELKAVLKLIPENGWVGIFDEAMEEPGEEVGVGHEFALSPGQRLVITTPEAEQFYRVTLGKEVDQLQLTRETVRPQLTLTDNRTDDFKVEINNNGMVSADNISQYSHIAANIWLADQVGQPVMIEKEGKKLQINGQKKKGKIHEIQVGEGKVFLVNTDSGWELVNEAVYNVKWKEKLERWDKPAGELKKFFDQAIKPRGWKDAFTLLARGISDSGIPGAWVIGAGLMGMNLVSVSLKEIATGANIGFDLESLLADIRQASEISQEIKQLGLSEQEVNRYLETGKGLWRLSLKAYLRQTAFGRLLADNTRTGLTQKERNWALAVGIGSAGTFLGLSELVAKLAPGGGFWRIFVNRGLLGYVMPEVIAFAGKRRFFGKESKLSAERAREAQEWLQLTLGVVSTSITTLVAAGFLAEGVGGIINLIEKAEQRAAAEMTPTPLVPLTEAATLGPTATAHPSATPTPTLPPVTPTETPPPTLEFFWQPGEAVDKDLLQHAADQNYGWGIDVNGDHVLDFQVFWLDQNTGPDVIRDADGNQFIRVDDKFYWDSDKSGTIGDVEKDYGFWELNNFNPDLRRLEAVNQAEAPNLADQNDSIIDIGAEDIAKAGKAGLAAPALEARLETGPLPPNIDLNGDNQVDLVKDSQGFFSDNNHDGQFTQDIDTRISGEPELSFEATGWMVNKIVYEDDSMWARNDSGELVGILPNGLRIRLDDSSGTSRLQTLMHEQNPAWSPWYVGRQAVINPQNLSIPPAPASEPPPQPPLPEVVIETEHGSWHEAGGKQWGVKSNGDWVWLSPEEGGVHGVLQLEMHAANPDLDPEAVTVVAHRVIAYHKDEVDAFSQSVADGSAVTGAVQTQAVIQMVNNETAILSVERFLDSNQAWLQNIGHDWEGLSPREKYTIAKMFVEQQSFTTTDRLITSKAGSDFLKAAFGWDEDKDIKNALAPIIDQVEADSDDD